MGIPLGYSHVDFHSPKARDLSPLPHYMRVGESLAIPHRSKIMLKLFEILANGNDIPDGYGFPLVKFEDKTLKRLATAASPVSNAKDVYFGCNPVKEKRWGGGSKKDLLFVGALGWDIDVESKRIGYPPRWVVWAAIHALRIKFGVVLESKEDGGLYAVLLLSSVLTSESEYKQLELVRDAIHAELVAAIKQESYEIDRPPNIVRVLRLPGSLREKCGGVGSIVTCTEQRYSLEELMGLYAVGPYVEPTYDDIQDGGEDKTIGHKLDELGIKSYSDILLQEGWTRDGDDWFRPDASSGSRSGVEFIGQNGRVGITIKTTGHEILPQGVWFGRVKLWVALRQGKWGAAAFAAEANEVSVTTAQEDFTELPTSSAVSPPTAKERAMLPDGGPTITNYEWVPGDKRAVKSPLVMNSILSRFKASCGDWPRKWNERLFVIGADGQARFLPSTNTFISWLMEHKPFDWEPKFITKAEFFESVVRNASPVSSIEVSPHFPPFADRYYTCDDPSIGDGGELDKLLKLLKPTSDIDRQLIISLMLSVLWGGPAGERPAFLVESTATDANKSVGSGKSQLTDIISRIAGMGDLAHIDIEMQDITKMKQYIARDTTGARVLLLDNAKGRSIGGAEFESLITCTQVSGHVLYQGLAYKENTYTSVINGNMTMLTKDMSQRCLIVRIDPLEKYDAVAKEMLLDLDYQKIVDDLYSVYCRPPTAIDDHTRRPIWDREILSKLNNPQAIILACRTRSASLDASSDDCNSIIETILDNLDCQNEQFTNKMDIGAEPIFIPSRLLAHWLGTNRKGLHSVLRRLAIPELQKVKDTSHRGYIWCRAQKSNVETNWCLEFVRPDGKSIPSRDFEG